VVEPDVRVFVQTRGTARATDYAFLGAAPPQQWWRAYRDATAFDHPTVLVVSDGARWAAYLSGIPSGRVDAVGTVIRWTLVLDGPCRAGDAACVTAAVAAWVDDVADGLTGRAGGRLAAALDERFPADLVDRMITRPIPGGVADPVMRLCTDATVVQSNVVAALASLPVPPVRADEAGDWLGGVAAPACRAAFVTRVAALLGGRPGRALLLNLLGGPDDTGPLLDDAAPVAVLVESTDPALARPTALRPAVEAKKAPAPPSAIATAVGTVALPLLAGLTIAVALVVAVLVLTLL
jgi:hypothetical protein